MPHGSRAEGVASHRGLVFIQSMCGGMHDASGGTVCANVSVEDPESRLSGYGMSPKGRVHW